MSQTSIAEIAVGAFLVFGFIDGFRKGLVKKGLSVLVSVLTLAVVYYLSPFVTDALKTIVPEGWLLENIAGEYSEAYRMLVMSGLGDRVDSYLVSFVARVAAVILTYIIIRILAFTLMVSLKMVSSVPGLSLLNRLAGAAFGLVLQMITLWLFLLLVAIFSDTGWGSFCFGLIMDSPFLMFLFENNVLLMIGILLVLKF